jgi:arylformamidase
MNLEAEYNNRARVPDHPRHIEGWARDAAAWRAACPQAELGLAYGPGEREKLDLFLPGDAPDAPLALFIHGGYWKALDRSFASHCARGPNGHGIAVAVPSYDLCPAVSIATIVDQMRAAALFLWRRRRQRMLAIGHSAGGQLAAILLATDWAALDPKAPAETAHALSPRFLPSPARPLHCLVGGDESGEYLRQSRDMAAAWGGRFEAAPGADHFTVIAPLAEPESGLTRTAEQLARG